MNAAQRSQGMSVAGQVSAVEVPASGQRQPAGQSAASRRRRWFVPAGAWAHRHRWLLGWLVAALVVSQAPLALAAVRGPAGRTGLGSFWFVNDFAQYESAMRQGAERADWLIRDAFTAEAHQPAFMFPLYVGIGKLAAALGLSAMALERGVEVVARSLLVLALWRFTRRFSANLAAARAAFLLALFGGGFGLLAIAAGRALGLEQPYSGSWSYETTGFGLLFAAPHVPLGMAATLELAHWLRPGQRATVGRLLWASALGAAVALLHPFHVPVLLAALGLAGLGWAWAGAGSGTLLAALAAGLGAAPALLPTVVTFSLDPFWSAAYTTQNVLLSPAPHELLVDMGPTLLLALGGAWLLRSRVAPFGLLLWVVLALVAMYLPVPYQRRLSFGLQPALAVMAGNALVALLAVVGRRSARLLRAGVVLAAGQTTALLVVSLLASAMTDAPLRVYRSTPELDAAAAWLDQHARPGELILADWDTGNYLAPRTPANVFGGHPVATLDAAEKRLLLQALFAHRGAAEPPAARRLGADWLVLTTPDGLGAGDRAPEDAAFQAGSVRVLRVSPR